MSLSRSRTKVLRSRASCETTKDAVSAVILFPVDRTRWVNYGWRPTFIQSARSGQDGSYQLPSLPEGDYFIIAVDVAQVDAWVDAAFLAAAATQASHIQLSWGDTNTLDLKKVKVAIK